ncbi:MAG: hypothetical protein WD044_12315 [Dongiaceae bacterium]
MRRLLALLALAPLLTIAPHAVLAETTRSIDPGAVQIADDGDLGDILMDEVERRLIRSYYSRNYHDYVYSGSGKNRGIPPGLAKKGWLPPGIAMQIARGQRIPGDVAFYRLPDDLRGQLPRRSGYEYYIVDDKVLLVREATNLILDVLTVTAIEALD